MTAVLAVQPTAAYAASALPAHAPTGVVNEVPIRTSSNVDARAVQATTADAAGAAPRWRYTGARYYWEIECHSYATRMTYTTGWRTQCRGPHTDGYYYLWAYH
ncbi:hypothetical protein [Streptomyces sp. NPDC001389]|uniref:hypothetical protein n=1 Tax=unclassified Streptomyces TaxID=2593676 RepID=UPI0036882C84